MVTEVEDAVIDVMLMVSFSRSVGGIPNSENKVQEKGEDSEDLVGGRIALSAFAVTGERISDRLQHILASSLSRRSC